ncbi:L-fucose kinase-like [Tubulanus polymorphus]|uniref:L-fucose kinase-like n=1 Tax=Tubulanus polymorphus TaxID=672921 RepID=UPI003DA28B3D
MKWTAIVVTCADETIEETVRTELILRQSKGLIDNDTLLITAQDPQTNVGSGGATVNALLIVSEHLCARKGFTVVNPDVLQDSSILIFHVGRMFPFGNGNRAFLNLPATVTAQYDHIVTNIDALLHTITTKIAVEAPPGVWVSSTDMFLAVNYTDDDKSLIPWSEGIQVCAISVPGDAEYAKQHGVYKINQQGNLTGIVYRGSEEKIRTCELHGGNVPMVCGVVYFSPLIAETLLKFHTQSQLYACTYVGVDSGVKPIELSLFFDFLLAMCEGISQQEFVDGNCLYRRQSIYSLAGGDTDTMRQARTLLWNELHDISVKVVVIPGQYDYISSSPAEFHHQLLNNPIKSSSDPCFQWQPIIHSYIEDGVSMAEDNSIVINSVIDSSCQIGSNTAVLNCQLTGCDVTIGKQCLVSGIQSEQLQNLESLDVVDATVLQSHTVKLPMFTGGVTSIITAIGLMDSLKGNVLDGTYCNRPWTELFTRTGITVGDLWDIDLPQELKRLENARLFPVSHMHHSVGLSEILWLQGVSRNSADMLHRWRSSWRLSFNDIWSSLSLSKDFEMCQNLGFLVSKNLMRDTLLGGKDLRLLQLYRTACLHGFHREILLELDEIGIECNSPGIAARTFANIAEVLACMADGKGGLRSGPAGNHRWSKAFQILEKGDIILGVKAMAEERQNWLKQPSLLVRAARHYEGAAQILVRHATATARKFINVSKSSTPFPKDKWLVVECCARVDIAGGWSDTPPITYEHGGAVINAAISIDQKRPIGAKIRKIMEPVIRLILGADSDSTTKITISNLSEFADYCQPHAAGALLKAAFLCTEAISYPSSMSLHDQLISNYNGGFELQTWSHLPHGSGLGTSSILAGVVMMVIWAATGHELDDTALVHSVLHLEQMLTTGGGWQDQVGGLYGGIKVGYSEAKLPLFVDVKYPSISTTTIEAFSNRLLAIYTGKTRLAKNLLQDVVRSWYSRSPDIVNTENQLVQTAWDCAKAFEDGDIERIGACMNMYWEQKKQMATGCEPATVRTMMNALRPYTYGMSLAGAGGGGFLYVLTKEPNSADKIRAILTDLPEMKKVTVHETAVCLDAFTINYVNL